MGSAIPQSRNPAAPAASAASAAWVEGSLLGVSARRINQLYHELVKIGAARREGRLYLFRRNHPVIRKLAARAAKASLSSDLTDCTESQRIGALRKERILRTAQREVAAYMAERGVGRTVAVEWYCTVRVPQVPELKSGAVPVGSFRRWEKLYRTGGLRALVDTRGGRQERGADAYSPEALQHGESLWLDDRKWSGKLCYELTAAEADTRGWTMPAYGTFMRHLKSISRAVKVLARHGNHAYESECAPRVKRDRSAIPAGDRYCGDEMTHDFYCRAPDGRGGWKRVRPILTAWQCERSRVFVGWHIDDRANTDTILAAFKGALRDWGTPWHVTIDNGHDYTCAAGETKSTKRSQTDREHVHSVFVDLDIEAHFTIPYNPQSKLIESNFNTVHERFDKLWDSYCGGSPEGRPEGACSIPVHLLPTLAEVRQAFAEWLTAFHARPHSGEGMCGYSPQQAWDHFAAPVRRERIEAARLDLLCSRYVGPRTVSKNGVSHRGIEYGRGDPRLLDIIGRKVWLRLDPDRADFVHVCDFATKRLLCTAQASDIAGASQADVRDHQRAKARRKRAVRAEWETRSAAVDTSVDGVIRAQVARAKSEQVRMADAAGPERVQLVRPDVTAEVVAASKRSRSAVDDDAADASAEIYSIFADIATFDAAGDDTGEADDFNDAGNALAELADLPDPDGLDDDAEGFAVLADLAHDGEEREVRYGSAG